MTDYKHTLNLPKTGFPMKANLAQRDATISHDVHGAQLAAPHDRGGGHEQPLCLAHVRALAQELYREADSHVLLWLGRYRHLV